ncbi:dicarboxylate/amino acid:cation symporter [Microbacterium testaceum]|uniref:Dicarboxylate/amino acid:cation symporter n=1 Tax=Microbacterium testaceum TaxID=2033 RepID=A0A2T7WEN6_MICTE|nr:dicarboxylate/amino acid:cation symporter [Microbacterium testaceum]PVE69791.1 dicarboxylate/amino acid:cation symporter [Microbacterium testaceum]
MSSTPPTATIRRSRTWRVLAHPASLIAIAAVLGIAVGLLTGEWAANLKFVGDLFIRLIQMAIVPLVMASVIVATGSMTGSGMGRLAGRTFGWMIGFSIVAALVGWALATLLQPGVGIDYSGSIDQKIVDSAKPTGWQETVLGFVSTNIFNAMSTASMLPIIVFSLLFGLALNGYVRATGNRLIVTALDQLQQVVLGMIRLVMRIAPLGVFCLLAALAGDVGFAVVTSALSYLGATLIGVIIVSVLFVVVVAARTRLNPWALPGKLAEQTVIAVTTTSSAVTFPTVLKNAVEKVGISQRVANFTLSVGLTMGSYGAVLNYTIVILFLAQAGRVELTPGQIVLGMALAIMLNMGTITVPGGFAVAATFLATSLGLPLEAVGLLIAVDWFTGVFRTFLNVNGDTMVALLVANGTDEIDRDVYASRTSVTAEQIDEQAMADTFAAADRAD